MGLHTPLCRCLKSLPSATMHGLQIDPSTRPLDPTPIPLLHPQLFLLSLKHFLSLLAGCTHLLSSHLPRNDFSVTVAGSHTLLSSKCEWTPCFSPLSFSFPSHGGGGRYHLARGLKSHQTLMPPKCLCPVWTSALTSRLLHPINYGGSLLESVLGINPMTA